MIRPDLDQIPGDDPQASGSATPERIHRIESLSNADAPCAALVPRAQDDDRAR
jgi:hypothetical protein